MRTASNFLNEDQNNIEEKKAEENFQDLTYISFGFNLANGHWQLLTRIQSLSFTVFFYFLLSLSPINHIFLRLKQILNISSPTYVSLGQDVQISTSRPCQYSPADSPDCFKLDMKNWSLVTEVSCQSFVSIL